MSLGRSLSKCNLLSETGHRSLLLHFFTVKTWSSLRKSINIFILRWLCGDSAATLRLGLLVIDSVQWVGYLQSAFFTKSLQNFKKERAHADEVNKMSQKKSTHSLWTSDKVLVVPGHPELRTRRHQIITNPKGWMIKEPQNRTLIKFSSIMMLVNSGQFYTQLPAGVFSSDVQDTPTNYCDFGLFCQARGRR